MTLNALRSALLALVVLSIVSGMAAGSATVRAEETSRFVSVIDDLPLMNGLVEVGEGVEFATPQGRIVEATARGASKALSESAVADFYAKTLPQLGWTAQSKTRFVREGETLDLIFGSDGGVLSVRFSLAPSDK